ncbi:MAG: hypothetical protein C5B55_04255 [Blastocatellia bacterium]|nr:MAG: hypothetical protein C5B55_04255 [Blastocatellia bacterium]
MSAPKASTEFHQQLDDIARTPAIVASLLEGIPEEQRRIRLSPEEFSATEQVCHLRDIELEAFGIRIRRILDEDRPKLADVDGGRLAAERDYNKEDVARALETFADARSKSVVTLSSLDEEKLSRKGVMEGVGEIDLSKLTDMMREHDLNHIEELSSLRTRLFRRGEY